MTFHDALTVAKIVEYEKEKAMKVEGCVGLSDEKEALILLSRIAYNLVLVNGEVARKTNLILEGEFE